jgi:hypothetical protein
MRQVASTVTQESVTIPSGNSIVLSLPLLARFAATDASRRVWLRPGCAVLGNVKLRDFSVPLQQQASRLDRRPEEYLLVW